MDKCPFCDTGTLSSKEHTRYHWQTRPQGPHCIPMALLHMECNECGAYITTPEQSRYNKERILATKKAFPTVLMP